MRTFLIPVAVVLAFFTPGCSAGESRGAAPASGSAATKLVSDAGAIEVEAACGSCQFGLPGEGCDLAVRFDGKAYYVDGAKLDDFGDAHADDGFCNTVRKARVNGAPQGDRFVATAIELLPVSAAK